MKLEKYTNFPHEKFFSPSKISTKFCSSLTLELAWVLEDSEFLRKTNTKCSLSNQNILTLTFSCPGLSSLCLLAAVTGRRVSDACSDRPSATPSPAAAFSRHIQPSETAPSSAEDGSQTPHGGPTHIAIKLLSVELRMSHIAIQNLCIISKKEIVMSHFALNWPESLANRSYPL